MVYKGALLDFIAHEKIRAKISRNRVRVRVVISNGTNNIYANNVLINIMYMF